MRAGLHARRIPCCLYASCPCFHAKQNMHGIFSCSIPCIFKNTEAMMDTSRYFPLHFSSAARLSSCPSRLSGSGSEVTLLSVEGKKTSALSVQCTLADCGTGVDA